ncbi:Carbohydrate-selective porin, OprB family [Rivularia sp. PCC 7116]|uniref:iron uptake porin n=1 Tax=Rivularia sp. PCC 7116 TaxID=373994 RepID=UPI00029ECE73|nr:iron uptake porin [Rivularia sp. PCC 7116]AFY58948.1 Carbohydrate-selective porin, OprB family [Rivularia sp. PCC 7116]
MKKVFGVLPFTSFIVSVILFNLSPVFAQVNSVDDSTDFQISFDLSDEKDVFRSINKQQAHPTKDVDNLNQKYSQRQIYLNKVTDVNQLQDISPEHWAYGALLSLIEKYDCVSVSGNEFNGDRSVTRYEFAFAFNTCLTTIEALINDSSNLQSLEDLTVLDRLQREFVAELREVRNRVDNLESQVSSIEKNQFSTTATLNGTVDFYLISAFGDVRAAAPGENQRESLDSNLSFSSRAVLDFDTSFTGKDLLRTSIQAGNVSSFDRSAVGTDMISLIGATNTDNQFDLASLYYESPIGNDRGTIVVAPIAGFPTRIFPSLNPVSSISTFGSENPIYAFAFGTGGVVYYKFTDELAGGISYFTTSGSDADEGLFGEQFSSLSQLTYTPSDKIAVAVTYGRYYAPQPDSSINVTGGKGSRFAQLPFGDSATSTNGFGLQFTYKLSKKFTLGGWGSYLSANAEASPNVNSVNASQGADADIWSWAVTAALKDLGKPGSQLNFVFGMPPKVTNNDILEREDKDTSLHFELSYNYPVNDSISITPGVVMITNPEHNADNDTIWVGLMKTTFKF